MKKKAIYLLATVLGAIAVLSVSMASWLYYYKPKTPEELLK